MVPQDGKGADRHRYVTLFVVIEYFKNGAGSCLMIRKTLPTFLALVITWALVSPMLCLAQADHVKLINHFVGTWKENEAKRKIGSFHSLRFRRAANGGIEELRGPESRPLVQPVRFGTKPYGTDNSKNTIAWKQIDASNFERQIFDDGKLLSTRQISISLNGKHLTEVTHRKMADGKETTTNVVFRRASGERKGLVGIWKAETIRNSEPTLLRIEIIGTDGVQVTGRSGFTSTWTFDGKPNPVTGPGVIPGMTDSAKVLNDNTVEITNKREGTLSGKTTFVLSNDGKTLTASSTAVGPNAGREPSVIVYEKE
jgi:hypothetical protein